MKPDILFFMVDQLSAKWLEYALDHDVCPLPNIRALMAGGTTFGNAITSNPVCCPTRATIATGMTTRGHGVLENGYKLDPALPTFMSSLQRAGYRTGAFGKCHFAPHFEGFYPDYKAYGFDEIHITEDGRGGEWLDWVKETYPEHYDAVLTTFWAPSIPALSAYGPEKEDLTARIAALRAHHQWATAEHPDDTEAAYVLPFPKAVSQTAWITGHVLRFLDALPTDMPLFAHVSYVQPHSPYATPAEYIDRVDPAKLPAEVPAEWESDPAAPAYFRRQKASNRADSAHIRRCYFADLIHLDEQLGLLTEKLRALGRLDNSYVIFLSDHGDLLGDHGFYGKEERHYDACIRVPMMIAGPGLRHGAVNSSMVQHEDIAPTILDMAGTTLPEMPVMGPYLKMPEAQRHAMYGASLLPLCRGEAESVRTAAYCESFNAIWSIDYTDWARTVRTEQYRYTYYADKSGEQLFDLALDADEQRNRAQDPEYAEVKQALRAELIELLIRQDFPKTRRNLFALGVH